MDAPVANAILAAARALPPKPKIADALQVVHAWAAARGWPRDAYGNYKIADNERIHFQKTVVNRQKKIAGDWRNLSSTPAIEMAQNLIVNAAKAVGDTEMEARARGVKQVRKDASVQRRHKAENKELARQARILAYKLVAHRFPEDMLRNLRNEPIEAKRLAEMKELFENSAAMLTGLLRVGKGPGDENYASVDRPPVVPFFQSEVEYLWVDREAGRNYSVHVLQARPGSVQVHIGALVPGSSLALDARTGRVRLATDKDVREGDAYLDGTVVDQEGRRGARVNYLVGREPTATLRVASLWCRMMKGYGVTQWIAKRPSDRGIKFVEKLAARGSVRVIGETYGDLILACR